MKRSSILSLLLIAVTSLLFVQCTHEIYEGADGINGIDGANGEFVCTQCHSDTHRQPIYDAYAISGHANGTSWERGTRASCAQCHNNQGYVDFFSGIYADEDGNPTANPDGYGYSSPITCTGCHSDHRSFDFENDGQDYALRNIDAIQLIVDDGYFIDLGLSNTCVACHQPRRSGPEDDGNGTFTMTSTHWGPHHGPQSTMLEGIQGMHIPGSANYPNVGSAAHRTGSTCTSCHMAETTDGSDGSHTFYPSLNACIACHTNGVPEEVSGLAAEMGLLEVLLENVIGWEYEYEVDEDGELILDENGDPIIVLDGNGDPVILEVHGIIHDGHPNTGSFGEGAVFTILEAEAAWNYLFVEEDQSGGLHNPTYSKALIRNSIESFD